ncbi:SDR family NAD(P)-dependent oxidoreductase [Amycolatopsis sacchari]|uniref:3-oxoacyl-[acyl-carrier protein] reductase n=1 Tax=Amycolatopsis sacchari TaxID=115433 RepID=A0A1I3QDI3_9PSEU|nr:SDR family NAD(P)-dependent oxidoreductase [Amycolatopsis sacchari]SFJ31760.1 3-oxoacyl-[acyl-carrier protein] reductase [Amycolatopsis sacchari]
MAQRVLDGKTVVVTGASQGIGEAVARRFAAEGARLVLSELSAGALQEVADDIAAAFPASQAVATVTDVTDPAACDALMTLAVERHGGLDVLAHATAVGQRPGPTADLAPDEWDRIMAVNAKGAFLLARSAIPHLPRPGGAIVFTGSYTGLAGKPESAAYSASKGALRLFTQSLALELAGEGVRVNAVAPSFVESRLNREYTEETARREGISVEEVLAQRDAEIPLGRRATAAEVAEAFLYLATPASSFVTGTWLDVTGGVVVR